MDLLDGPAMDEVLQQSGPVSEITAIKVIDTVENSELAHKRTLQALLDCETHTMFYHSTFP
jgi:hypothetical protein